jgi:hypothetical protein
MTDFLAGNGAVVPVSLQKNDGTYYDTNIVVPPLTLDLLFVDNFQIAAPNDVLLYNALTDRYGQPRASAVSISADTVIHAQPLYYIVTGGAMLNSAVLRFFDDDDMPIRYNPLLLDANGYVRPDAVPLVPGMTILNPNAILFKSLLRMKQQNPGARLTTMISENGDGINGFHVENLAFDLQADGLETVYMWHK